MKLNSVEEWRRLTEHYREISDEELYELDADSADLTEQARQVLRDEMKTRGLDRQRAANAESHPKPRPEPRRWEMVEDAPRIVGDREEADDKELNDGQPREFTWKTLLCECNEIEEAWQLREVLRRAGIDSWVEGRSRDLSYPRVVVAADQLQQAREIAAQPVPQEIIDEFNTPPQEYSPPVCPMCGAADPVLESADPVNAWLCESCGAQWTEAVEAQ